MFSEVPNDDTEPTDTNNRNYKTMLYVESNEEEVNEIPRHVYKKMDARRIQSVCVPLEGPDRNIIILNLFNTFRKKQRKIIVSRRGYFLKFALVWNRERIRNSVKGKSH